jgi:hypothetical protein
MSAKELDWLEVIRRVVESGLTQVKASELLGRSSRQVRRMCRAFEAEGAAGLVSAKRGQPSNRRLPAELKTQAMALVRERYADFGPLLAREKLAECHNSRLWCLCPGCPPCARPVGVFLPRSTPGGSDDGGFDEWLEFCRNRATSASSSAIRFSAIPSLANAAASSCVSSAMRWSRGSFSNVTQAADHEPIAVSISSSERLRRSKQRPGRPRRRSRQRELDGHAEPRPETVASNAARSG